MVVMVFEFVSWREWRAHRPVAGYPKEGGGAERDARDNDEGKGTWWGEGKLEVALMVLGELIGYSKKSKADLVPEVLVVPLLPSPEVDFDASVGMSCTISATIWYSPSCPL